MRISVKFNPAFRRRLPPGDRRIWLLGCIGLRIEKAARPLWRFEVFHRRLGATAAIAVVVGYLAATTALWFWLERNPHNQAGWGDVVRLAWRWDDLRRKRGDTAIKTGQERLRQHDYVEAFHYVRTGLGRSPGNVEGRLLLASLLAGYEPARALGVMEDGIAHSAGDPRFLSALFGFYAQLGARDRAATQLQRIQALPAASAPEIRGFLARVSAEFLAGQGKFAEALAALPPEDLRARARLLLRAGQAAEARSLASTAVRPSAEAAEWARLDGDIAVALGDADALRRALRQWRALEPDKPAPYLYGFEAWHRLNRPSFRDGAEREYYEVFGRDDAALQAFAAQAVNLDLADVVERARQVAVAQRLSGFAFLVHRTEIALRRGEFEQAVRELRGWERLIETLPPAQRFYPEFIRRLARQAFAGEETTADHLVAHLSGNRAQAQLGVWLFAARTLEQAGDHQALRKLLRPARAIHPHTDALRVLDERFAAEAIVAALPAAPVAPTREAPEAALARMDQLLRDDAWGAARDLLRSVRAGNPGGLGETEAAWARRELRLAAATQDVVVTRSLVRRYLERHRQPTELVALVELAAEWRQGPNLPHARVLADEVATGATDARVKAALAGLALPNDLAAELATLETALRSIDSAIAGSRWSEAERLLTELRNRPPTWLATNPPELKAREIQARLGLGQRPLALAALKDLVVRSGAPRSTAFKLVRDYATAGEQEHAVYLAREIVRLLPGEPAAEKLLEEARAPRPTTAG